MQLAQLAISNHTRLKSSDMMAVIDLALANKDKELFFEATARQQEMAYLENEARKELGFRGAI